MRAAIAFGLLAKERRRSGERMTKSDSESEDKGGRDGLCSNTKKEKEKRKTKKLEGRKKPVFRGRVGGDGGLGSVFAGLSVWPMRSRIDDENPGTCVLP